MAAKKKSNVTYIGTGRRKTAVARVFMTPGTGAMSINGKTLEEYLPEETLRMVVRSPLELTETLGQFDIKINVCGRWIHRPARRYASGYRTGSCWKLPAITVRS